MKPQPGNPQLGNPQPGNPYYDLAAIQRPEMFFGRSQILRRVYSAIANKQCISLVGSRHIGKSSVLSCMRFPQMQRQFEYDLSRHVLVFIDLREYLHKTSQDFFSAVSEQIVLYSRKQQLELALHTQGGEYEFGHLLDQIQEQGFHPVLLMDAFDNVTRNKAFDPEFFSFLRAQARKVSYVTASLAPLSEVCHRDIQNSPFFNIFGTCFVEALTPHEAQALVQEPAQRAGLPFTQSETAWILKQAGRHPFFLQRVCHFFFEEKCVQGAEALGDTKHVLGQAASELQPHFQDAWERLTSRQQELLKEQIRRNEGQQRAVPELSESALFRAFVRQQYRVPSRAFQFSNV